MHLLQLQLWLESPKQQLTLESALQDVEPPYNSMCISLSFELLAHTICIDHSNFGDLP